MAVVPLVLELDLLTPMATTPPQDPLSALRARNRTHLTDVIEGLRRGARDQHVGGLIAQCDGAAYSPATAQELREAVREFRRSGKPAVAWAQSFGELAPGTVGYFLATAFDEIWLQPSGDIGLTGLNARAVFLREALDRLGLHPELGQRYEYKNAADTFTQAEFTEAHRESLGRIVESTGDQLLEAVCKSRGIAIERVRELINSGIIGAAAAKSAGLIDHVGYRDEAYTSMARRVGGRMRLRYVGRYNQSAVKSRAMLAPVTRKRGCVALIYGHGPVTVGRSSASPMSGGSMGSETISASLRAAARDESVKSIVFRVDSPGGSYVASDTIRREVLQARRAKPVIASMGAVAGSGGYFVSMGADVVVAAPATITGSIGVLAGKMVIKKLLTRLGVRMDSVSVGEQAGMFSPSEPFTDAQWEIIDRWLDGVYDDFVAKVAHDRGMARDDVHSVAKGRIWTGADAHRHGLVDQLGGLVTAVGLARIRGGLPARNDLSDVRTFPKVSLLDRMRPAESSQSPAATSVVMRAWGPMTHLAAALGLPAAGPLTMPFSLNTAKSLGEWK
ncbi:signal peptide peptidase SppA [Phytoactinopolyspora mesophila]|uniref:Signal peptide peptidase SppA n=1 Tax=Phytoactinopolyspora mesophila TaxID=2650750 RepID=A0A7K3M800_9ACTN|nr:signal peptide peptidase SppA [Phytoactinopolyspora mesophila]NDL59310.1 signal peptide peptidase SppA [Phytoactinopolyspora mesophila]